MKKEFVNYKDLRQLGFGDNQARRIIRLAKKKLVEKGYAFYNGKRVRFTMENEWGLFLLKLLLKLSVFRLRRTITFENALPKRLPR